MRIGLFLAFLASSFLSLSGPALAQSEHERAREQMEGGKILSYTDIRAIAVKAVPGRVVGQTLSRLHSGRPVYLLRILQQTGRVMEVTIDAETGKVLNVKGKR